MIKLFLNSILLISLVAIAFSLAYCELNLQHLVYLGHLPQFKETAKLSTLTHWFDSPAKTKVLNTKLCTQWGIKQGSRPPQCQDIAVLGIGAFPHLGKSGCSCGNSIFCNLGRVAKWVMPLASKPTGQSISYRDSTLSSHLWTKHW